MLPGCRLSDSPLLLIGTKDDGSCAVPWDLLTRQRTFLVDSWEYLSVGRVVPSQTAEEATRDYSETSITAWAQNVVGL
jgi:hypothetical protein